MKKTRFSELWDELLTESILAVTTGELVARSGSSRASVHMAVAEAQRRRRLYSPAKGLYIVVPLEYRDWGAPPVQWFIDDLCRHLGRKYYVGYLSAAQHHGASHQAPQLFQVVVDRKVTDRLDGPHRIRFHVATKIDDHATQRASSPGGVFQVATPETLALDLAEFPKRGAGLGNVATILQELTLDPELLVDGARSRRRSTSRRLGYLLEHAAHVPWDLSALRELAQPSVGSPTKLEGRGTWSGDVDERWGVLINAPAEGDA